MKDNFIDAQSIVKKAFKLGATQVVCHNRVDDVSSLRYRNKRIENIEDASTSTIAIQVIKGNKQGITSSQNESQLLRNLEKLIDSLEYLPEDKNITLPSEDDMLEELPVLEINDESEIGIDDLTKIVAAVEEGALSVSGIDITETVSISSYKSNREVIIAHSPQSIRNYQWKSSLFNLVGEFISVRGDSKIMGYDYLSTRFLEDLPNSFEFGENIANRIIKKINPQKIRSQMMPVLYDATVSKEILEAFISLISGPDLALGNSCLIDMLGKQVFDKSINIVESPHRPRGVRSSAIDGVGVPTDQIDLVKNGKLNHYLLDIYSANKLGKKYTPHTNLPIGGSIFTTNIMIEPSEIPREDLMNSLSRVLVVTDIIGHGFNKTTGDYSVGVAGLLYEGGEFITAIHEATIAGNFKEMFSKMVVASDFNSKTGIDAPSILIDQMTVAGGINI